MFLNIKSALFFIFIICFKVCSLEFDDFRNELSIPERNEIASRCIMASFENESKIVDTAIHIAKGQHIRAVEEICDLPIIPLCIPIKCEPNFLNFVRDFYLLFDTSPERKGAITKLNELRVAPIPVKDIDVALQIIDRTFLVGAQLYPLGNGVLELSSKIRNVIKVLSYIPTKIQMLDFMPKRFEAAKKAGIQETDPHFIAIKEVDPNGEKSEVIERFNKVGEKFYSEVKEQTLVLLDLLERIKGELDPQIRGDLLRQVVPGMRLAAELFISNKMNIGTEREEAISSEEMLSVLDQTRGKSQKSLE